MLSCCSLQQKKLGQTELLVIQEFQFHLGFQILPECQLLVELSELVQAVLQFLSVLLPVGQVKAVQEPVVLQLVLKLWPERLHSIQYFRLNSACSVPLRFHFQCDSDPM